MAKFDKTIDDFNQTLMQANSIQFPNLFTNNVWKAMEIETYFLFIKIRRI